MTLLLVRHAKAGDPHDWDGPGLTRPLTDKGRRQAMALIDVLTPYEPQRMLASTALRCIQTLEPLAAKLGYHVEPSEDIAEGAPLRRAVDLVRGLSCTTVLCSHGDTIPGLLEAFAELDGLQLPHRAECAKGSVWVLDGDGGRYTEGVYVPLPL